MRSSLVIALEALPDNLDCLHSQPYPVIAYGEGENANADVVVANLMEAEVLERRVELFPQSSMTLVQVLRSTECLSVEQGLDIESLAYSVLQSGKEFSAWKSQREAVTEIPKQQGEALRLVRKANVLEGVLNRPELRNSITVEMRDALIEALELLQLDNSIEIFRLSGEGDCFSVGGELREFGTAPDPVTAHWVRSVCSPARMFARLSQRIHCFVHGACLGSGIELPAFASHLVAHPKSYFQLPELTFGLIPGAGGTVSVSRRIGRQKTAWLVLSGRRINAQTALAWGLVDELLHV